MSVALCWYITAFYQLKISAGSLWHFHCRKNSNILVSSEDASCSTHTHARTHTHTHTPSCAIDVRSSSSVRTCNSSLSNGYSKNYFLSYWEVNGDLDKHIEQTTIKISISWLNNIKDTLFVLVFAEVIKMRSRMRLAATFFVFFVLLQAVVCQQSLQQPVDSAAGKFRKNRYC